MIAHRNFETRLQKRGALRTFSLALALSVGALGAAGMAGYRPAHVEAAAGKHATRIAASTASAEQTLRVLSYTPRDLAVLDSIRRFDPTAGFSSVVAEPAIAAQVIAAKKAPAKLAVVEKALTPPRRPVTVAANLPAAAPKIEIKREAEEQPRVLGITLPRFNQTAERMRTTIASAGDTIAGTTRSIGGLITRVLP